MQMINGKLIIIIKYYFSFQYLFYMEGLTKKLIYYIFIKILFLLNMLKYCSLFISFFSLMFLNQFFKKKIYEIILIL